MRSKRICSLFFIAAASCGFGIAKADSLSVYNWDTRAQGSYSVDPTRSQDGDGSLRLTVTGPAGTGQDKVSVIFANGSDLGTLGSLSALSLQAYKSSSPVTGAASDFAYRIQLANGDSLVYENAYNGSATVATDQWRDLNLIAGNFWLYDGVNHNGGSDAHGLSYYSSLSGDEVVGLQVAYGSGLGGFDGNVDNVHLAFGGTTFDGPVAAPLPSSALGGFACLGLLAIPYALRRRHSKA